jgi:hypothetical protein
MRPGTSLAHFWQQGSLRELVSLVFCTPQWRRKSLARWARTPESVAATHGGQCLGDVYVGSAAKYRFRCAQGHEWSAIGNLVLGGTWCRTCAKHKRMLSIEKQQEVARERGVC